MRWLLRPIGPDDAEALVEGFRRWSPEERRHRFHGALAELSPGLLESLTTVASHDVCLVLSDPEDPRRIVAGARLAAGRDGRTAEFAVSVDHDMHGHGLGRLVFTEVLAEGRRKGIRHAWGIIERDNMAMRGVALAMGFEIAPDPDEPTVVIARRDI